MQIAVVPGPGNGHEIVERLTAAGFGAVRLAKDAADLAGADVLVTPRGPSRSFSSWYQDDPLGQAVLQAFQDGTPWIAFCGSALPLASQLGAQCDRIQALSLVAMRGDNDRLMGQDFVETPDGRRLPFHFTSAPAFEAGEGTEVLGRTHGQASVLRGDDVVICSGLPLSQEGWAYVLEAIGIPVGGARA